MAYMAGHAQVKKPFVVPWCVFLKDGASSVIRQISANYIFKISGKMTYIHV
jgi:hypothetical protein